MLVVDTLTCQMELPFSAEDLLHVYTVVWLKREPHMPLSQGNQYMCLKHPNQPQTRLVTRKPNKDLFLDEFAWVLDKWLFKAREDCLWSLLRYNGCFIDNKCFFH